MAVRLTWLVPVEVTVDLPDYASDTDHDDAWNRVRAALEQVEGFVAFHELGGVRIAVPTVDLPDPTETYPEGASS